MFSGETRPLHNTAAERSIRFPLDKCELKYTFTDIASEEFELLALCSSHYRTCWQESYAGRLSKIAMNELLEQSSPGELKSWLIGHGNCRRLSPKSGLATGFGGMC